MLAERVADRVLLTPVGHVEEQLIKEVPGVLYSAKERVWTCPLRWPTCLALQGIFDRTLELGPELMRWGLKMAMEVDLLERTKRLDSVEGHYSLEDYQRVAVAWMTRARTCLLGDEMRVGKTDPAAVALKDLGPAALPALIVTPPRVMKAWQRVLSERYPDANVVLIRGSAGQRRKLILEAADGGIGIIGWPTLRFHSRLAPYGSVRLEHCTDCDPDSDRKPGTCHRCARELNQVEWQTVIADEVHRAVNPKSQQTRALWAVAEKSTTRWGLSGTISPNGPEDMWAPLHFLDPEAWPRRGQYLDRYCYTGWNAFGGLTVLGLNPHHKQEFYKAVDPWFMRRTLKEVGLEVPTIEQPQSVTLSPKERKAYDAFKKDLVVKLDSGDLVGWNPLVISTRLLQLGAGVCDFAPDGSVRILESSKVDAFVDWLEDVDEPVLAFAVHRDLIAIAKKKLGDRAECLVGGIKSREADDLVDRFQSGNLPVLLATYGTGGEGLTFNRSRVMARLERPWSMVQDTQGTARQQGWGQDAENLLLVDFIAEDTFEDRVTDALGEKVDKFQEIVRDHDRLRELL